MLNFRDEQGIRHKKPDKPPGPGPVAPHVMGIGKYGLNRALVRFRFSPVPEPKNIMFEVCIIFELLHYECNG